MGQSLDIPQRVVAVAAEILAKMHTHARLESAFLGAGASMPIPAGTKVVKARDWLFRVNKASDAPPLHVLGLLLSEIVDDLEPEDGTRLLSALEKCGLRYSGGKVVPVAMTAASKTLEQLIADRDWEAVDEEFQRALGNVVNAPADAVSAACNLLESLMRIYLEEEKQPLPAKKDIGGLWDATKKHLGLDPAQMAETDIKTILGGLGTVTAGIGALRTHASTAHGQGKRPYRIAARHARLAVNAAHTIATFIVETWDARSSTGKQA